MAYAFVRDLGAGWDPVADRVNEVANREPSHPRLERLLALQRTAGNMAVNSLLRSADAPSGRRSAVGRLLARQGSESDAANDRPEVAKVQVQRIGAEHPGLDTHLVAWASGKAQDYLTSYYKGRKKQPSFSDPKVWKKPSDWGELDVDIPFKLIEFPKAGSDLAEDIENLEKAREGVEERHAKVRGRLLQSMKPGSGLFGFLSRSDDLLATLDLVEWWDGREIVIRSWRATVRIEGRDEPGIDETSDHPKTPAQPPPDRPNKSGTG
jgi:hypothetical protein